MAKPDLNTSEGPVEIPPWYSFLAGLSSWTGISQNRLLSIGLVVSALAAFLAGEGFDAIGWDSAGLLLRVSMVVAGVGSVVVLLPSVGRRIVVSLLILFHFAGILSAVTSVEPAPWISHQLWTCVFRPYLQFFYLNNAYHFYSPEPGPAHLMWFCIEYDEGPPGTRNFRWVFVPDVDSEGHPYDPENNRIWSGTEYTRLLSMAENAGHRGPLPANFYPDLLNRRIVAGEQHDIPTLFPLEMSYPDQYREPNPVSKKWIQAYARHVAHTFKHQDKPDLKVTGVKFYMVIHKFLLPDQLAAGHKPQDPDTFLPFYYGEFDADGNMKKACQEIRVLDNGGFEEVSRDPFLYWLIPIEYVGRHAEGRNGMVPWEILNKGEDQ